MSLKERTRQHFRLFALTIIVLSVVYGCANKTGPTGGPKDENPPQLLSAIPKNGQLNYSGTEVVLEFDEYVQADKAKEQIIITPRIDGSYTIKQRRNRIILEFDSAFAENTTYTVNFRESIVDITERNPAQDLVLAFSTGDYIDSLQISGYVQHVLSGTPGKNITIALYPANDTTDLFSGLPVYFTESNDSGRYVIRNIKDGKYRIYSFNDSNRNLKAESKNESFGFFPDTLQLDANLEGINMNLVNLDVGEFKRISARPSGTTFDIRLNKYIVEYSLIPEDSTLRLSHYYAGPERQTISVYNHPSITDSIRVALSAIDSLHQTLMDTVWIKFTETRSSPDELTMQVEIDQIPVTRAEMHANVAFNKPVANVTRDSAFIYLDSLLTIPYDSLSPVWNETRTNLQLSTTFPDSLFRSSEPTTGAQAEPGKQVINKRAPALIFRRGAFSDVENDSTTARDTELPFVEESSLAVLQVNITASTQEYFLQLINSEGKIIAERQPAQLIRFRNLPPGDYILRAIIDVNQNGKWDSGNILENQLPENIVYFTTRNGGKQIGLRANFEVTESFQF